MTVRGADRPSTQLRRLLAATDRLLVAPVCTSPLSARMVEELDFPIVYVGGYATGATKCLPEPLLGRRDMVEFGGEIARRTSKPVIVDGGAGFGEPMHADRTVRDLIDAGIAGMHLEDQGYPKRAHYHRDYQEHVIEVQAMTDKIAAALEARDADPDFVLIGRTDSMRTDGYDEGIARCNAYLAAGADAVMLFPNDLDEAERAPGDIDGPAVYVNSWGNRVGRPLLTTTEAAAFGYRILIDAQGALLAAVAAARNAYLALANEGACFPDRSEGIELRRDIERWIGLDELYAIEERTVETATE
jgi:2-methylisocitrate lyase-like PEP mutase family enzyme